MSTSFLVLHDPKGEFWEGALVEEPAKRVLEGRGACTIPVNPERFSESAVSGFMRRAWGAGWRLKPVVASRLCPLLLHVPPGQSVIHWRARLIRDSSPENPVGSLRLVHDSAQRDAHLGGLSTDSAVDFAKLPDPDQDNSHYVGGFGRISVMAHGFFPLSLWGAGTGLRVVWAAVSVV